MSIKGNLLIFSSAGVVGQQGTVIITLVRQVADVAVQPAVMFRVVQTQLGVCRNGNSRIARLEWCWQR